MSQYTVLFDANVLYPAPMRDALMQLAVTDLFKAKWTADIHREWIDALLRNEPHRERAALERTRGHCQLICTRLNAACSAPVMRSSRVRSRSKDQRHRIGRGGTMWR